MFAPALLVLAAAAAAPEFTLPHSAFILDGLDKPFDGDAQLGFGLFDAPTEGAEAWTAGPCTKAVRKGYVAVVLGDDCGTPIPASALPADAPRWLELRIDGEPLLPRVKIGPAANATVAVNAQQFGSLTPDGYWKKSDAVDAATLGATPLEGVWTKAEDVNAKTLGSLGASAFWQKSENVNAATLGSIAPSGYWRKSENVDAATLGALAPSAYWKKTDSVNATTLGTVASTGYWQKSENVNAGQLEGRTVSTLISGDLDPIYTRLNGGAKGATVTASGTTSERPSTPATGNTRWNSTLGTMEVFNGTAWLNVNTPPIGSTYIQWQEAAAPGTIYPNTTWVSTDIADGAFLRNRGGNANVAAGGALTGTLQADSVIAHTHAISGGVTDSPALTTSSDNAAHFHTWGGNWSNDNSAVGSVPYGDGTSNIYSDGVGYWGMGGGGGIATGGGGSHGHTVNTRNDDFNCTGDGAGLFGVARCPDNGWYIWRTDMMYANAVGDHTHTVYNHRHWIQARNTTTNNATHGHSVPQHGHANTFAVGAVAGATAAAETRPANEAVIFWRRTL